MKILTLTQIEVIVFYNRDFYFSHIYGFLLSITPIYNFFMKPRIIN